ncbi:MAG: Ig domain-containing protein, partial [Acidimicrobiales bacterium]
MGVSYLTAVANTTKVVSNSDLADLQSMTPDGSAFRFSPPPPSLADVAPGDIIVGGPTGGRGTPATGGFLRRVTSLAEVNGALVLETAPATLNDAVGRGSFDVNWPTTPVSAQQARSLLARATVAGSSVRTVRTLTPYSSSPIGPPTSFLPGFQCGGSGNVTLSLSPPPGEQSFFSITPHLDASWSWGGGLTADAYVEIVEGVKATASVAAGVYCQETVKLWGPDTFGIPDINFSIGPVPVNISVLLEIDATLKAEADTNISMSATQGFTLEAGAKISGGKLSAIDSFTPQNSFTAPTGSLTGYVKASVGPKVTFAFYCYDLCIPMPDLGPGCDVVTCAPFPAATPLIGPTIGLDGFLKMQFSATSQPAWELTAGLEATVGFNFSLGGLFNLNAQITIPIGTDVIAASPPVITTPTTLPMFESGTFASPWTLGLQAQGFEGRPGFQLGGASTSGGTSTWSLVSTEPPLPANDVSLSPTGVLTISGVPQSFQGSSLNLTVGVTDPLGSITTATFTSPPVLPGMTAQWYVLPQAEVNVPYSFDLQPLLKQNQGGTPPYTCSGPGEAQTGFAFGWNIVSNPDCTFTGSPAAPVGVQFAFHSASNTGLLTTDSFTKPTSIVDTIAIGPLLHPPSITVPGTPLVSEVGAPFSFTPRASGGQAPYNWDSASWPPFQEVPLPPGLNIDPNSGTISGTPTTSGVYDLSLVVRDNLEGAAYADQALLVGAAPSIATGSLPDAEVGASYQTTLSGTTVVVNGRQIPHGWQIAGVTDATGAQVPLPGGHSLDPN